MDKIKTFVKDHKKELLIGGGFYFGFAFAYYMGVARGCKIMGNIFEDLITSTTEITTF